MKNYNCLAHSNRSALALPQSDHASQISGEAYRLSVGRELRAGIAAVSPRESNFRRGRSRLSVGRELRAGIAAVSPRESNFRRGRSRLSVGRELRACIAAVSPRESNFRTTTERLQVDKRQLRVRSRSV